VHHDAFLYISLPSLHDYDVRKCLISRFVGDVTKTKRQKPSFSSREFRYSFLEFTIKKIVNISQIERDGIKRDKVFTFLSDTVEPRYNEGPRDWRNVFAITRFCYIEVIFHIFCYYWGTSLYRGSTVEVPL